MSQDVLRHIDAPVVGLIINAVNKIRLGLLSLERQLRHLINLAFMFNNKLMTVFIYSDHFNFQKMQIAHINKLVWLMISLQNNKKHSISGV